MLSMNYFHLHLSPIFAMEDISLSSLELLQHKRERCPKEMLFQDSKKTITLFTWLNCWFYTPCIVSQIGWCRSDLSILLCDLMHTEIVNTPGPTSRSMATVTKLKLLPSMQKSDSGKEKISEPTNPSVWGISP